MADAAFEFWSVLFALPKSFRTPCSTRFRRLRIFTLRGDSACISMMMGKGWHWNVVFCSSYEVLLKVGLWPLLFAVGNRVL